jgi:exonuclease SbcD
LPAGARALFTCIPTVNKAVVAATVGAAEAAQAVGEHLALLLRGYAPIHRAHVGRACRPSACRTARCSAA